MNLSATANKTLWGAMTELPATLAGRLWRVAAYSLTACVLLALSLGLVTHQVSGRLGLAAMTVALLIALISNIAGTLPACWALGLPVQPSPKTFLGGMAVRLAVLCLLAVPVAWSGILPRRPLLLWLAGGYFVLLMIETTLVALWIQQHSRLVRRMP